MIDKVLVGPASPASGTIAVNYPDRPGRGGRYVFYYRSSHCKRLSDLIPREIVAKALFWSWSFANSEKAKVPHAPGPSETDGEASNPGPRMRMRGPRSLQGQIARRKRNAEFHAARSEHEKMNAESVQAFRKVREELSAELVKSAQVDEREKDRTHVLDVVAETVVPLSLNAELNEIAQEDGEGETNRSHGLDELCEPMPKKTRRDVIGKEFGITSILLSNIRSVRQPVNFGHLCVQLEEYQPDLVALNETWLTESTKEFRIPGYRSTARLDRLSETKSCGGGVDLFCKKSINHIALLKCSSSAERTWSVLHSDVGPILICNWYRAGDEPICFESFRGEYAEYSRGMLGTIILGDLNVHHRKWLRYSTGNTLEGEELMQTCMELGLRQMVREPTRGANLLDLVLTDLDGLVKTKVVGSLADHRSVLLELRLATPQRQSLVRKVWSFDKADWDGLRDAIHESSWSFISVGTVDEACQKLTDYILTVAHQYIPEKTIHDEKGSHPWVNDNCRKAVNEKHHTEKLLSSNPTEASRKLYLEACSHSSGVLGEAYDNYVEKTRGEIRDLEHGSKKWWMLNRELNERASKATAIPPLKDSAGRWALGATEKADLIATTLSAKCALPPQTQPPPIVVRSAISQPEFALIRRCWSRRTLEEVKVDKATGPDSLPGRILKYLAAVLDLPVTLLTRRMINEGIWPTCWRTHWLHPLFKKGVVYDPCNYRGLHLTPVLSKVVERIIATNLKSFMNASNAYGCSQWAFREGHSCRDLVALVTARWLLELTQNRRVGVYLSDISGAFDRVSTQILMQKLEAAGVSRKMLKFLESYLAERVGTVLVEGAQSKQFVLSNMIFQGTVIGPILWNLFFADVSEAIPDDIEEDKFADDLTASKSFEPTTDDEVILANMKDCQEKVHAWGLRNRAVFDRKKEYFAILDLTNPTGEDFRLLGTNFDGKMTMTANIEKMAGKARSKVAAMIRSAKFYSVPDMVLQYKTHVLGLVELNIGGFYHATETALSALDQVQHSFLKRFGLTPTAAFLDFNLAPLSLRRDVGMLGLLFRCVHGLTHDALKKMFPLAPPASAYETRQRGNRHSFQLEEPRAGTRHKLIERSIFGLVRVWNRLPQNLVDAADVSNFQKGLTRLARVRCHLGLAEWSETFTPRRLFTPAFETRFFDIESYPTVPV